MKKYVYFFLLSLSIAYSHYSFGQKNVKYPELEKVTKSIRLSLASYLTPEVIRAIAKDSSFVLNIAIYTNKIGKIDSLAIVNTSNFNPVIASEIIQKILARIGTEVFPESFKEKILVYPLFISLCAINGDLERSKMNFSFTFSDRDLDALEIIENDPKSIILPLFVDNRLIPTENIR